MTRLYASIILLFVIPTEMEGSNSTAMGKKYFVYILRNYTGNFYIGITSNLIKRIYEHKNKLTKGFTEKYNIDKLIYFEEFNDPVNAISREKQLKNWSRKKKISLIIKVNPTFKEIIFSE